MSTSTPTKLFFVPLMFTNDVVTWAYPMPHLLAMHLEEANATVTPRTPDIIEFYFSTDRIEVEGHNLRKLWEELTQGRIKRIRPTAAAGEGGFRVQKLKRWKDNEGLPEIIC